MASQQQSCTSLRLIAICWPLHKECEVLFDLQHVTQVSLAQGSDLSGMPSTSELCGSRVVMGTFYQIPACKLRRLNQPSFVVACSWAHHTLRQRMSWSMTQMALFDPSTHPAATPTITLSFA